MVYSLLELLVSLITLIVVSFKVIRTITIEIDFNKTKTATHKIYKEYKNLKY